VSFDRVFEVLDAPNPIEDRPGAIDLVDPVGRVELDQVWFRYPASSDAFIASLENPAAAANLAVADAEGDGEDADETERETDLRTLESLDPVDALHALDELAAPDPSDPDAQGPAGAIVGDGAPYVLQAFDAVVEPGQLVAIVGPSGAGKSTLASLVPRLYDVSGGAVRIDGHDVRDLTQTSLRAAIGVVSQDSHLFHDSVLDNLRYAKPEATMDEVIGACRAAQIHDVIAALPEGYDTVVGERGYRLSGGEKQRIAIARMLLKDPAVVILDEATSHLDAENEALVQAALTTALEGRTSIVIAHRLSTIVSADQILVIDGGQLVDRGRHAELLARGGLYAELYTTLVQGGTAGSRRPAAPPDEARAEDANLVP
jgi:ATP-binding cassette subfamily B protein